VELSRWLGAPSVRASLFDKMRDAIKEDIEKLMGSAPEGRPQAQRFTRSELARQQQAAAAAVGAAEADAAPGAAAPGAAAAFEPEVRRGAGWLALLHRGRRAGGVQQQHATGACAGGPRRWSPPAGERARC
jgi:hypothetical protein